MTLSISIVVPIFNDGYLADKFCSEIENVLKKYFSLDEISSKVELIFVDDGSREDSIIALKNIIQKFNFAKGIFLSRNFGQHIALSCGYKMSTGEYVGMLNVDMQDPPSEIPKLLRSLEEDECDIAIGIREKRIGSKIDTLSSFLFNYFLNKLTGQTTPLNVATLRFMNRKFVNAYNSLEERFRYIPALECWLGFRHKYIAIEHHKRIEGKSSYTIFKKFTMAIESILSFSDLPLKIVIMIGFICSFVGFLMTLILITSKLFFINFLPGFTSLMCAIIFFSGLQITVLGISAIYIGRILKEVQRRPIFVIKEMINF